MATVRRTRAFRASAEELWAIVGDAHHLPRWWPRVSRVEGVDCDAFTTVLQTAKGKSVRADFRVLRSDEPRLRSWEQEVSGTPFERILASSHIEIALEPAGDGTDVTIVLSQRPRGLALLGSFMVRSAAGRQVDEALDALDALVTGSSVSAASSSGPGRSGRR